MWQNQTMTLNLISAYHYDHGFQVFSISRIISQGHSKVKQ